MIGIFIVLSGFATTDLSVIYCDACQGGGAYGKTAAVRPLLFPIAQPLGFSELLHACSFRSPQPNGRSVATE
ncbi:hypothetical protein AN684_0226775 [Klebsiella pneumoniae subsp. pneumoniae]|nr:hypothetical protein AN675_0227930 [Klebsiella pneumoniae subsp. pneumoniae]OCO05474.1 hypothetical protein AN682_0228735 [Klebsiella pneumoniae subsp. pneumoniae]OCO06151.1 hypothetical protein AN681_0226670 [Klebsiella pneumoniae subsp. pneumoniae]OCO06766.1 hypothetical protein AN683_0227885 [Klebsiella pneumoniae subsp. pneumoniae]OCO18481.1 hypothetical protein AN684_0226775 [Klebsiella pneumoniae subsp. pneumoniae]